jgi:hypothetical protein
VQVCGNGYFLSTQQNYGATDFIFTFTTPSSVDNPTGGGLKIGVAKDGNVNGGEMSVSFNKNGVNAYFIINGNGVPISDIAPNTTYSIRYMTSTQMATFRNETTSTNISTRLVSPAYSTYAIFLQGSNWGGITYPIIISGLTIKEV